MEHAVVCWLFNLDFETSSSLVDLIAKEYNVVRIYDFVLT